MSARLRPPRSLQAKALQLLAQREQSRVELRRKLMAHVRAIDKADAQLQPTLTPTPTSTSTSKPVTVGASAVRPRVAANASATGEADPPGRVAPGAAERVDAVLAWLDEHHFASDERFTESRVNARQGRFGNLRIRQELASHTIALSAETARQLAASELERAIGVSERKFATPPVDAADAARQSRFLIARGFSPDTVRRAVRTRLQQARSQAGGAPRVEPDDI